MCKCNECDKYGTENCTRMMEKLTNQNMETMHIIEIEALKQDNANHWKYIEKLLRLISSESFWKVECTELRNRLEHKDD